jgi:hypothetical protein
MEINPVSTIASQEISNNKAQAGLDVLTRTIAKSSQVDQVNGPQSDSLRADIATLTGKGQNIDIKA